MQDDLSSILSEREVEEMKERIADKEEFIRELEEQLADIDKTIGE